MAEWNLIKKQKNNTNISQKFNISKIFEQILINRGIDTIEKAGVYLNPKIDYFKDTLKFKDIQKSFEILKNAIYNNKKIIIYGDYDVDGVSSTVILYKGIKNLGANVEYYIPDREKEGYGLNLKAVEKLKEMNGDLIFTCDNGIASFEETLVIKSLGMDIIILDHHEPQYICDPNSDKKQIVLPKADAIIDAKQDDCNYPFKMLCAGGMSYKYIKAFYKYIGKELKNEAELFVFSTLATVCDIVDLVDENRIIVRNGLKLINNRNVNPGLTQLIKVRELDNKKITETSIGFVIGPCINACGRLKTALDAVKLFTTEDMTEANILAEMISNLNDKRKQLTQDALDRAIDIVENSDIKNDKIIVIYDEQTHESVAGIVAGRIKELYYKPTIVLTKSQTDGIAKGSARSINEYNIFEEMLKISYIFERFGGHSMAAGLSLKNQNIQKLREELNKNCTLTDEEMTPKIDIDMELDFSNINLSVPQELDLMRPIGKENPPAIFLTRDVKIKKINFVGANKNMMQYVIADKNEIELKAVDFNNYNKLISQIKNKLSESELNSLLGGYNKDTDFVADIVYEININEYNGNASIQLRIIDFEIKF